MSAEQVAARRYEFAFAPSYRLPGLAFGVTPATAWVELTSAELTVRYGPWRLRSALANVAGLAVTGGFSWLKTAGPPHLSFSDRGVSFATNGETGVCLRFHRPVAGIDPTRRIRHPGATVTVADVDGFLADLRARTGLVPG
ncbi:MAG: hypothetical protein WB441_07255 [Nocardioidaceae bacterium]